MPAATDAAAAASSSSSSAARPWWASNDLYAVLQVPRTASEDELRRAYRRRALTVHPDKNRAVDEDTAKAQFQAVQRAWDVLSDRERRVLYDEQGVIDDELGRWNDAETRTAEEWARYFRARFRPVSAADVQAFAKEYRHGDDERADVLQAYVTCAGDVERMLETVPLAEDADEARFADAVRVAVRDGELQSTPAWERYEAETPRERAARLRRRKRAAEQEAAEAAEAARELYGGGDGGGDGRGAPSLEQAILARRDDRDGSVLERIAAKYAAAASQKNSKKKMMKKKKAQGTGAGKKRAGAKTKPAAAAAPSTLSDGELDDEAFAAAQARLLRR